jgi:hypothetical protein
LVTTNHVFQTDKDGEGDKKRDIANLVGTIYTLWNSIIIFFEKGNQILSGSNFCHVNSGVTHPTYVLIPLTIAPGSRLNT